jgi:hypothetical protein
LDFGGEFLAAIFLQYAANLRHISLRQTWVSLIEPQSERKQMARFSHYSPPIRREIVRVLYHERVRRKIPMTRLVESILTDALRNTASWQMMEEPPSQEPTGQQSR